MGKAAGHYRQSLSQFLGEVEQIVHGTTLGTNILITERGAKVGMITTKGFRDSIEMRRAESLPGPEMPMGRRSAPTLA